MAKKGKRYFDDSHQCFAQVLQIITAEHYLISAGVNDKIDLQENIKKIDSSLEEIVALINDLK